MPASECLVWVAQGAMTFETVVPSNPLTHRYVRARHVCEDALQRLK